MTDTLRKKLARGARLMLEHVWGNVGATWGLNKVEAEYKNATKSIGFRAPFKVSFHVPYLDSEICNYHLTHTGALGMDNLPGYCMPFLLPPLQDTMLSTDGAEPVLVLQKLALSFDQTAEPAALTGTFHQASAGGNACDVYAGWKAFDEIDKLNFRIVIYEKTPLLALQENAALSAKIGNLTRFNWQPNFVPEQAVYDIEIPSTKFVGAARANPYVVSGLGRQLDPYKTYMVAVLLPDFGVNAGAPRDDFCLPSFVLELELEHALVRVPWRESGGLPIQNCPTIGATKRGNADLAITKPVAGQLIEADTEAGVSTALARLDVQLRGKLKGGQTSWCNPPGWEAVLNDGAYDVIVVPLYKNLFNGYVKATGVASGGPAALPAGQGSYFGAPTQLPYYSNDTNPVESRRLIPLPYPFEVHHVFACHTWQKADVLPQDLHPGLTHKVGVGIGCGMLADHRAYAQVAYAEWTHKWSDTIGGGPHPAQLLDRWTYPWNRGVSSWNPYNGSAFVHGLNLSWEIFAVPLVYPAGDTGVGWITQGKPFYVGSGTGPSVGRESWGGAYSRSPAGLSLGGPSGRCATHGAEQWLEVRWQLVADDKYGERSPGFSQLTLNSPVVGYQGNHVIIVGRKYLTSGG